MLFSQQYQIWVVSLDLVIFSHSLMQIFGGQQFSCHATDFQLDLRLGFDLAIPKRNLCSFCIFALPHCPVGTYIFSLDADVWLTRTASSYQFTYIWLHPRCLWWQQAFQFFLLKTTLKHDATKYRSNTSVLDHRNGVTRVLGCIWYNPDTTKIKAKLREEAQLSEVSKSPLKVFQSSLGEIGEPVQTWCEESKS